MFLRLNKSSFVSCLIFLSAFLLFSASHAYSNPIFGEPNPKDEFCKSHLLGTMSAESCAATCGGIKNCTVVQSYKSANNPGLTEDLDCYGCGAGQSCYDLGLIPKFPDCMICEMNPKKVCVSSLPVKNPLGIGPGAIPLPKAANGQQCYDCIDRPPMCNDFKAGSSPKAACEADCNKKKDHKCVSVGVNPKDGVECFVCQHFPKPKETCRDMWLLSRPQCATACAADQDCVPAGMTKSGEQCFQCVDKNLPPPPPPPPETCESFGWQAPQCSCQPGELKVEGKLGANNQLDCCKCVPSGCTPPDFHKTECKAACEDKGGKCIGKTRTKNDPDCYWCSFPKTEQPKETCQDFGMLQSCNPFPCSSGDTCQVTPVKTTSNKTIECAECIPGDVDPQECAQHRGFPNCAWCYQSGMACKMERFAKLPTELWCARCYFPKQCQDENAVAGACTETSCSSQQDCVTTNDGCHFCKDKPKCEDTQGLFSSNNCGGACDAKRETCEEAFRLKDDPLQCFECVKKDICEDHAGFYSDAGCSGKCKSDETCKIDPASPYFSVDCWHCEKRIVTQPPPPQCDQGTMPGACPGSCSEEQNCEQVNHDCYQCQEKPKVAVQCPDGTQAGGCPGQCSSDQKCSTQKVGDKTCHKCERKWLCADDGMLTYDKCLQQCIPNGGKCEGPKHRDDDGEPCYSCLDGDRQCPQGMMPGSCVEGTCPSGQTCSQKDTDQGPCYQCQPGIAFDDECAKRELGTGPCPGTCSANQECVGKTAGGQQCHQCKPKQTDPDCITDPDCDDGQFCNGRETCDAKAGKCLPGYPPCHGQECEESSDSCIECDSDDDCADASFCNGSEICDRGKCLLGEPPCHGQECDEQNEKCVEKDVRDPCYYAQRQPGSCLVADCPDDTECDDTMIDGVHCHWCQQKPRTAAQCLEETQPGACPGSCSSQQECVAANVGNLECHKCQKKKRLCADDGMQTYDQCAQQCIPSGGKCEGPKHRDDDGEPCYSCLQSDRQCPQGMLPGRCVEGTCPLGQACSQTDTETGPCYQCRTQTGLHDECSRRELKAGACPGTCSTNQECVGSTAAGQSCHQCKSKPVTTGGEEKKEFVKIGGGGGEKITTQCDQGYSPGSCADQMDCFKPACYETFGPCYMCKPGECRQPYIRGEECGNCVERGGKCVPAGAFVQSGIYGLSEPNSTDNCYECKMVESCEKYDLFSTCEECYDDEVCVPAKKIKGKLFGKDFMCVDCIPRDMVITRTYIIVIIAPDGILIVKDDKGLKPERTKGSFEPAAQMAMAEVDDQGRIKNSNGEWQKIQDFIGGFSTAFGSQGLATTKTVSMDALTSKLQESLSSGAKFSQSCFDNLKDEGEGSSKPSKDKKSEPSRQELEEKDSAGEPAVTGPVVSCGNVDGEKALSILSSGGQIVQTITQKLLKANPNAIVEAFQKAQDVSAKANAITKADINSVVNQFTQSPANQFKNLLSAPAPEPKKEKKKSKEAESTIVPNDPFYMASEKAKKKQEKKQEKPKVSIGGMLGGMEMGIGAMELKDSTEKVALDQWGLPEIGFTPLSDPDSAWNVVSGDGKNVLVAVIDSGLDMAHPDSPEYVWVNSRETPNNGIDDDHNGFVDDVNGWNFLDNNNDLTDVRGHGTFVAGIIAAKRNNGIGIAGINPGAVIMPLKVADGEGLASGMDVYRAINYAVDNGARIINVSMGGTGVSALERVAINRARSLGAFVVVAAGNEGEDILTHHPSNSRHAFAVGQTDISGARSTVTNFGPNLALLAPGEQIYSLVSKDNKHVKPSLREIGYYTQSGTSFPTPMVAAVASLLLAKNPSLTPEQIENILLGTTRDMEEPGWDGMTGSGFLDATKALRSPSGDFVTARFTDIRKNLERKEVVSIDVFAQVKGSVKEYTLEAGKGKNPRDFETIEGPFTKELDYGWLTRLVIQEKLRGSKEWVLRLKVIDNQGQTHYAQTLVEVR